MESNFFDQKSTNNSLHHDKIDSNWNTSKEPISNSNRSSLLKGSLKSGFSSERTEETRNNNQINKCMSDIKSKATLTEYYSYYFGNFQLFCNNLDNLYKSKKNASKASKATKTKFICFECYEKLKSRQQTFNKPNIYSQDTKSLLPRQYCFQGEIKGRHKSNPDNNHLQINIENNDKNQSINKKIIYNNDLSAYNHSNINWIKNDNKYDSNNDCYFLQNSTQISLDLNNNFIKSNPSSYPGSLK